MPRTSISYAQRAVLIDALVQPKPFYGEGIWSFPRDQLHLFLRTEPHRVCLSKDAASPDDMKKLAAACDPATFGLNKADVLDESYRKAGKLDKTDFAINLDVVGSGLLKAVHDALFGWEDKPREVRAELYKLNVYGPGSFFKAHKDTPRSEDMFGSLVLNFPTQHEGGALVLRHDGREVTLDASKAQYTSADQVSWAAFYSDVEHEVLPVKSGHRVTLTYNLYFTSASAGVPEKPPFIDPILAAFTTLLADKTFMPKGGHLGFGLAHQYPISNDIPDDDDGEFFCALEDVLKGSDRALFHAAKAAGVSPKLSAAYDFRRVGSYLVDKVLYAECQIESWEEMMEWHNATKIAAGNDDDEDEDWRSDDDGEGPNGIQSIAWIVPRNKNARIKSYYVAYGNEASLDAVYGDIVLTATVPPADKRS